MLDGLPVYWVEPGEAVTAKSLELTYTELVSTGTKYHYKRITLGSKPYSALSYGHRGCEVRAHGCAPLKGTNRAVVLVHVKKHIPVSFEILLLTPIYRQTHTFPSGAAQLQLRQLLPPPPPFPVIDWDITSLLLIGLSS